LGFMGDMLTVAFMDAVTLNLFQGSFSAGSNHQDCSNDEAFFITNLKVVISAVHLEFWLLVESESAECIGNDGAFKQQVA